MKSVLEIQNLKCGGCAHTIVTKLSDLKDIEDVQINIDNNTVTFHYKNEDMLLATQELLAKIGYPVVGEKNAVTTKAKSFVSCAIGRMNN